MEKLNSKDSEKLLDKFITDMDKAISNKLISENKSPNFLSLKERWELISIKYIKEVGAMIEKAQTKFVFIDEKTSKKYIKEAIKSLELKKDEYLKR